MIDTLTPAEASHVAEAKVVRRVRYLLGWGDETPAERLARHLERTEAELARRADRLWDVALAATGCTDPTQATEAQWQEAKAAADTQGMSALYERAGA